MQLTKTIWIHIRINTALKKLPHTQSWLPSPRTNTEYSDRCPPKIDPNFPRGRLKLIWTKYIVRYIRMKFHCFFSLSLRYEHWILATGVLRKLVLVTRGSHLICNQQKRFEYILELTQLWNPGPLQSLRTNTEYSDRRPPKIGPNYPRGRLQLL